MLSQRKLDSWFTPPAPPKKCFRAGCGRIATCIFLDEEDRNFGSPSCKGHRFVECHDCMDTGEVTTMEKVYSNEPHTAPIGVATCHCKIKEPDDFSGGSEGSEDR